jgi:hypothetical protein
MYHLSRRLRIVSAVLLLLVATGACRIGTIGAPGAVTPALSPKAETPVSDATRTPTPPLPTITPLPMPQEVASPTLSLALDVSTISYQPIFAPFKEPTVKIERAVFQDRPAPDLADVLVPFVLTKGQRDRLEKDGVVVGPGIEKEFFTLYEKTRYANVPIFVTSDSLLHVYHLLFDKTLRTAETGYFIPLLRDLNKVLLSEADKQYTALKGTPWEDAALRTAAYVGVGSRLLDAKIKVPDYASRLVNAELGLIRAADGIHPSPIFTGLEFGEDYSQYIPRGHDTRSEALKAYFKAMMWYGRMTFRLKTKDPEVGRAETRSALLLVYALRNVDVKGRPGLDVWADLYDPTVFFVGRSDDLVVMQYARLMDELYGKDVALKSLADDAKLDSFIELANQLPAPRILGMVIQATDDEAAMTKGLRFMGQRFVPDAYIFRQLVWRNVGEATVNRRGLPKGLDVLAAMGSERAYRLLDEMGDTKYKNYPEQMQKINAWVTGLTPQEWTETLYNSWLYTFHPLLDKYDTSYPRFMQSLAWQDKQLNTVLGSWAELKHDTILYAKQVYAEMGGGGPAAPEPVLLRGYVEPVPFFYARLAGLAAMTREGLTERKMLNEQDGNSLQRLEELSLGFKTMAEKELSNKPLTQAEYDTIRYYGGDLEHLTMAAADTDTQDENAQPMMEEEPQAAVIADVATDPDPEGDGKANPSVLEVGVGRVNELYAVVPMTADDGKTYLQVARGGAFSYYEFPWPADDRLTDEKWRKMLDAGQAPPLQKWTVSFFSEDTTYSELQQAIYAFQTQVNYVYWDVSTENVGFNDQIKAMLQPYVDNLKAQNRYEGRQLVSSNYRSFDLQSNSLAVVTVRETWQDGLYKPVEFMGDGESEPIAKRGPYTLDVTYTVEKIDGMWQVTNVVYANEPPPW